MFSEVAERILPQFIKVEDRAVGVNDERGTIRIVVIGHDDDGRFAKFVAVTLDRPVGEQRGDDRCKLLAAS